MIKLLLTSYHSVVFLPPRKIGRSFDSSFLSFLASDPYLVMPNFPRLSVWSSLAGIRFQFLASTLTSPANLSSSLSQEMHFRFFLVRRASRSFSSSSEITRIIYLILDSMNRRAFFTSTLSHFIPSISFIYFSFCSVFYFYFEKSHVSTFRSSWFTTSFIWVSKSDCRSRIF